MPICRATYQQGKPFPIVPRISLLSEHMAVATQTWVTVTRGGFKVLSSTKEFVRSQLTLVPREMIYIIKHILLHYRLIT